MSAPDTKDLVPAPRTTITRTDASSSKSRTISIAASHMSSDTALWRSGLLKIIQPMPSVVSAIILSVRMVSP
jgi:hypothetical protein